MHVGMAGKKDLQLSIVQGSEASSVSNTWEKEVSIAVETPEGEAFGSTALKLRFFGQKSCIDVTESNVCYCALTARRPVRMRLVSNRKSESSSLQGLI